MAFNWNLNLKYLNITFFKFSVVFILGLFCADDSTDDFSELVETVVRGDVGDLHRDLLENRRSVSDPQSEARSPLCRDLHQSSRFVVLL